MSHMNDPLFDPQLFREAIAKMARTRLTPGGGLSSDSLQTEDRRWYSRYGMTGRQFEDLYQEQGGRCAICLTAASRPEIQVDHDHHTMQFRGLLCRHCNFGLGFFRDDPKLLARAMVYLDDQELRRLPPPETGEPEVFEDFPT